ncbi:Mog1p/PsbP-like protein [Aaosphaeria arxii CBS 175.79]|uniref:Mog1p/PsbP-like protein n=1 Tax=Aaosphaeria arxii CBS 175.79 TaxID=1450172 RepID=A0A6A5XFV6_9PLEO|nr:Mog1p/PsbP-like protein [Aaosphaeria arxii CBS 175.79]KAF2011711.1 Mog1p/PsbP-like protein [Aaosphaeria arxii CBS 175.79]
MSFKSTPLYGGAITVDFPTGFGDASNIRQIPDHQEVWLDADGYSSIVVDILEYVNKTSDEEALQYHFHDLIDGTGDSTNMLEQASASMPKTPNKPVYTLSFIQTPQPNPRKKEPEFVAIHLILLRLKEQATDIMVTVNLPHYANEYVKAGEGDAGVTPLMRSGEAVAKRILESFQVNDWGLFEG